MLTERGELSRVVKVLPKVVVVFWLLLLLVSKCGAFRSCTFPGALGAMIMTGFLASPESFLGCISQLFPEVPSPVAIPVNIRPGACRTGIRWLLGMSMQCSLYNPLHRFARANIKFSLGW